MKIIEIASIDNGAHRNQTVSGVIPVPDGWAVIPDGMVIPETFPFVNIEVNGQTVTSMTAGTVPEPEIDLDAIKDEKVAETKSALKTYLEESPLTWTDGNQYNVTEEKQSLLTSQLALYQTATAAGQPYTLKWNTTGGVCTEWAYEDLAALALAIGAYVQPLVSYQQTKEVDIMNCETVEAVEAVVIDYGTLA